METVFDHRPTQDELRDLFGAQAPTREEYERFPKDADTENGRLYDLFALRGDLEKAGAYLARVEDPRFRRDLAHIDVH
jgi:hypothetical protein